MLRQWYYSYDLKNLVGRTAIYRPTVILIVRAEGRAPEINAIIACGILRSRKKADFSFVNV